MFFVKKKNDNFLVFRKEEDQLRGKLFFKSSRIALVISEDNKVVAVCNDDDLTEVIESIQENELIKNKKINAFLIEDNVRTYLINQIIQESIVIDKLVSNYDFENIGNINDVTLTLVTEKE